MPIPPAFDAMAGARQALSMLDPTGVRPKAILAGIILALFFGAQVINAVIPAPRTNPGPGTGPGTGPISGPGQPGQTLPPIAIPSTGPGPSPGTGQPLPPGSVLEVGPLRIPLESGWQPQAGPSDSILVRLVKGSAAIDLVSLNVQGGTATPANVYAGYMGLIAQDPEAVGFSNTPPSNIQIGQGLPAARGSYTGVFGSSQIEGEATAFVTSASDGWVWDAYASAGTLRALLPEAQRMIDNIQVVPQ